MHPAANPHESCSDAMQCHAGTGDRESPFSRERASWLSEADVAFFVGSGHSPVSNSSSKDSEAEAAAGAVVQRRVLIGLGLAAGGILFGLVGDLACGVLPVVC
jgi:hypothetical protein